MAKISDADKAYFLSIKREDISYDLISNLFADKIERKKDKNGKTQIKEIKSKYEITDTMTLKAGEYINKTNIETTLGRYFFNRLIVEPLIKVFGDYKNITIDKNALGKLDDEVARALRNDVITAEEFIQYINTIQWLGMKFTSTFTSSFTPGILTPNKKVIAYRDKELKAHEKEIDNGDIIVAAKIEKECLKMAKEELKNDDGMYLYKAEARGSFDNNYKNISVMKGPVLNPRTGKWKIVKTNFVEGIMKEDIAISGNSVVTGAYPKAIGQRTFGYFTKQITAALQSTGLDGPGSDCQSKVTIDVTITSDNAKSYEDRYIIENGKLVCLDEETIKKYIGKTVHMRTPMFCLGSTKICRVCAGRMMEKLGIDNIGLTASRASSTMSNASMKKFHDTTVKLAKLNKETITT